MILLKSVNTEKNISKAKFLNIKSIPAAFRYLNLTSLSDAFYLIVNEEVKTFCFDRQCKFI